MGLCIFSVSISLISSGWIGFREKTGSLLILSEIHGIDSGGQHHTILEVNKYIRD